MNKKIKYGLAILAGIIALIIIGFLVAVFVIDPNAYKGQIENIASKQIGRELSINGDIELSVFPWIGMEIQDIKIKNAPGFKQPYFLNCKKAEVKVKLFPLIKKEIKVGTVQINNFSLYLTKKQNGQTNWQDLIPGKSKDKSEPAKKTDQKQTPKKTLNMTALILEKFSLSKGSVIWNDLVTENEIRIHEFDFTLGPIKSNHPFNLNSSFDLSSKKPKLESSVSLEGEGSIDWASQLIDINNIHLVNQVKEGQLPKGKTELSTDVRLNWPKGTLDIKELQINSLGLGLQGQIKGDQVLAEPNFSGHLELIESNLKEFLGKLNDQAYQTKDKQALTSVSANMSFEASPEKAFIRDLRVQLDQSLLQGHIDVPSFKPVQISFDFNLDRFDVDKYLPPEKKEKQRKETKTEKGAPKEIKEEIPLINMLGGLKLKGRLHISKLRAFGLKLRDVELDIQSDGQTIKINPLQAGLYQGYLNNFSTLNIDQGNPVINSQLNLKSVQVGDLVRDLTGKKTLTGKGLIKADLKTKGRKKKELIKNSQGQMEVNLEQGSIKGLNIAGMLINLYRVSQGQEKSSFGVKQTDFVSLNASAYMEDGKIYNRDLRVSSPLFVLTGSGSLDLLTKDINYLAKVQAKEGMSKHLGSDFQKIKGVDIPIKIQGSYLSPNYMLDLQEAIKEIGQEKIKKEIQEHLKDFLK